MSLSNRCPTWEISIHALREEGDLLPAGCKRPATDFYPRPPRGGRPRPCWPACYHHPDFYPRPPRGGRPVAGPLVDYTMRISIHALREEGDPEPQDSGRASTISIHALREEGDERLRRRPAAQIHFYPRPPRGGRPIWRPPPTRICQISIHALREEGDLSQ